MTKRATRNALLTSLRIVICLFVLSVSLFAQDRNPIILIPGLTGSELKHKVTGERIWFKAFKSKSEDLRLPISTSIDKMHDDLIPGDIIREVKIGILPATDVYGGFIRAMEMRAGYHEESWTNPSDDGDRDAIYVFAYDWRLDNVENAQRLVRDVEALKRKLKTPDLKFDIVAHSMGGIISRYAAMYGDADLPTGNRKVVPTWAGAKLFDKVILLGTPNEGAMSSLGSILNGYTVGGLRIDLPFIQDSSKFTVFTIPSAYQLLPAPGTFRAFDDKLKPLAINLYDPKMWSKYGWNAIDDDDFNDQFDLAEQKIATAYFTAALDRAKRLHEALAASNGKAEGVAIYLVGSDCKTALDGVVIYRDGNNWKTLVRPKGFTRSDGSRVTDDELKKVMQSAGDGVVTQRSLEVASILKNQPVKLVCEDHNKLAANARIQDYVIRVLEGKGSTIGN
ncbi:MAG: hypothetical protein IPI64_04455 [Chloracidobacterium sp.]|nr:hypothetical protein [Chloracidobacterium sp.]